MPPLVLTAALLACFGQRQPERPAPLDPAQALSEARALVADLLAQRPAKNLTHTGVLKIRAKGSKETVIPFRFEIITTATNWMSVYDTTPTNGPGIQLTVIHADGCPNRYLLGKSEAPGAGGQDVKECTGAETMVPFAASDFWLADLGLEFLHWPTQRLLKKELRKSQSCDVLESINSQPGTNAAGYVRVVSWIAIESGGIVHADAYDARNELIKQFDPKKIEKVNGVYELQEMEIRNQKTGSRTRIDFDLD